MLIKQPTNLKLPAAKQGRLVETRINVRERQRNTRGVVAPLFSADRLVIDHCIEL